MSRLQIGRVHATSTLSARIQARADRKKNKVVESCQAHNLFPPKSTRHLIPSRPLGIGVPLLWLKNRNIEEAEAEFEKYLAAKRVRRLPEGSMVGSRRYMEEVFLFE